MGRLISIKTLIIILLMASLAVQGQIQKPATWSYKASKTEVKKGETIELIFTADIQQGWYMYSVGKFESAPATTFTFNKNAGYELMGATIAIDDKKKVDEYIGEYRYFTSRAEFRQKVRVLSENPVISGVYEFSTCSSESGICLPPKEEDFSFKGFVVKGETAKPATKTQPVKVIDKQEIKAEDKNEEGKAIDTLQKVARVDSAINASNVETPSSTPSAIGPEESYIDIFFLAFVAGILALITPCVFPMIPMTVTFFLKSSRSRAEGIFKAFVYGASIVLIYTIIGTLVAKFAGAEAANFLSTHWLPNLFFFATFIVFALSFLGLYEITLPSALVNASDRQSDRGGYLGIFFMAATLVLVSFSCTGPIVGTILVQSAGGATLRPMVGMLGFSLAFAIPFTLFAIFPSWLQNLPKSGGWLNSVKVILGFVELALAFKFFSLADQAYHWNLLDREINIAIWIAISLLMGLYLIHKIRLPHDDTDYLTQHVSVPKIILACTVFSFIIYLLPGMVGAPLKALSGYLPPMKTHDFDLPKLIRENKTAPMANNERCENPKYADDLELPHGLQGYFDYKQALACARQMNKPIFVDFTGHGCVNCREMEANVWSDPEVLKRLQQDFIVLALYVDDKTELPQNEWYISTYDGKEKRSVGKQNADFQISRYKTNAQPYYLVIDSEGNTLSGPVAYDRNITTFINFLDQGKANFKGK